MTQAQAVAQIFMTAFHALPRREQDHVLSAMVRDRRLREDLIDLAVAEKRSHEPARGFRQYLKSRKLTV